MLGGFLIFFLVLAMLALFAFAFRLFGRMARKPPKRGGQAEKAAGPAPGACPVCGAALKRGEKIRSAVFPGGSDRICHIFGCPRCLSPESPMAERRGCPVCGAKLGLDEYLIARLFERGERRRHVHILGCKKCRMG